MTPPLVVLGVSRSGTTLLRVILDRSPGLAIPDESFFVPLLARRHGKAVEVASFLDDVARIHAIRDWGLSIADVAPRIRSGMPTGEAIAAIYDAYAEAAGKPRWGDKTPMYMRHLSLLDELFPDAQYVHLIRDGRDAALSFLQMPEGTYTRTWAHPTTPAEFACLWRKEVADARALGRRVGTARYHEVRYEALVADPDATVRAICAFADAPVRAGDARLRGGRRRLVQAAPTAAAHAAHHGRAELARRHVRTGCRRVRGGRGRSPVGARLRGALGGDGRRAVGSRARLVRHPARSLERVGLARPALAAVATPASAALSLTVPGASRPGVAMTRPFSDRKYVRSVAIPAVYLPSGIRQAIEPSSTRSA